MRKEFCQACSFARSGVKTRRSIDHTCSEGRYTGPPPPKKQYVPTREELDKYIARLKEFWDEEKQEWKV